MISTKALLKVVGQPTPTGKTLLASQLNLSSSSISRNYPRYNFSSKRLFCDKKVAETSSKNPNVINPGGKVHDPTPPPPPPGSGGNGMWLLLVAALAGGGYYFREEISQQLGGKKPETSSSEQPKQAEPKPKPIEAIKQEVKEAEEKLKKIEAAAQASKPVPVVAVPVPEKPKVQEVKDEAKKSAEVNWEDIRKDIVSILDDENYDDGSYGPVFVRLAWHHAGTYDKNTKKGGTEGAAMRFVPELKWGANAGLDIAQAKLEPIKKKYPDVTYSDLWSFAGTVALEEMGLPKVNWRPGRKDCKEGENVLPDGLLPDADGRQHKEKPQQHVREIFNRMGFNDQEIVALLGAHAIGRCHTDRSGFWGPWTNAPTTFSNEYFRLLLEETWSKKKTHKGKEWKGPEQYEDKTGELMMLPTDLCLVWDPKFKKYVEIYAKDEERFFKDFTKAWLKLQENNVKKFHGWRRYIFFGPRE